MEKRKKLSQKLWSSKVKFIGLYKSRTKRPCDFCRKRKSCCIIKVLISCIACVESNKGVCTFVERPIKTNKNASGKDTMKADNFISSTIENIYGQPQVKGFVVPQNESNFLHMKSMDAIKERVHTSLAKSLTLTPEISRSTQPDQLSYLYSLVDSAAIWLQFTTQCPYIRYHLQNIHLHPSGFYKSMLGVALAALSQPQPEMALRGQVEFLIAPNNFFSSLSVSIRSDISQKHIDQEDVNLNSKYF